MPEWWTYRLSDFLLFSPRTYYRMIERYNEALWPVHLVTLTLGCMMLVLLLRSRAVQPRIIWWTLAVLWAWTGGAFLWRRYSSINWAAAYLVPLFVLQAILLAWAGWVRKPVLFPSTGVSRASGMVLLAGSLFLYPAIAPLAGRPWRQAEVFGMTPDPTAVATVGLILLVRARAPAGMLVIPVVWCFFSGLTLWAMRSPEAWVPPLAAVLGLGTISLAQPAQGRQGH